MRPVFFVVVAMVLCAGAIDAHARQSSQACRMIAHAMGQTCVPENPQRIIVLDTGELDISLALGVRPIGSVVPGEIGAFPLYLSEHTHGIEQVGNIQQPSLERIAKLKPDLILGSKQRHGRIYEQMAQIAPTVFSARIGDSWKENVQLFAQTLNKEEVGNELLKQYKNRISTLSLLLQKRGALPSVSLIRSFTNHVRIQLSDSFTGSIFEDLQLPRPVSQQGTGFAIKLRSPDAIETLNGDLAFVSYYGPKQTALLNKWKAGPFWSLLNVKRLYEVDDSYWMLGIGPIAALKIVHDLEKLLGDD